ncbi:diaminopimelate epimerase [Paeniglutamicibacter cryotolerans]|uniref:Diaminopimelate epimerase n=1 Tax=Paeniglutamicibacter cryotolerans TaxID=670079 RepID=A0A839QJ20_9MICC|nr:diaminopimelate epimerase [Paeniglutamicibacter cryotolerans]MBB2996189.1 diaminopimelate epimerase [Paeniglutamicibacter cryotolerans]
MNKAVLRGQVSTIDPVEVLSGLSGLAFAKAHATGNDFVLLADPRNDFDPSPEQVAAICDRHRGVGGDGLIRAVPSSAIEEGRDLLLGDPSAYWFMDYRNADGSLSEMCGNGVRAFVHFLVTEGFVELPAGASLSIATRAGIKTVTRSVNGYAVGMGPWAFAFPAEALANDRDSVVDAEGLKAPLPGLSIDMGNPHTVVTVATAGQLAGLGLVRSPRVDPLPAAGTNVEFVLRAEPLVHDGIGEISMRVHERGVGETLSCGTGACAAALATRHWAGDAGIGEWNVAVPGGVVKVRFTVDSAGDEQVELSGPAVMTGRGVLA